MMTQGMGQRRIEVFSIHWGDVWPSVHLPHAHPILPLICTVPPWGPEAGAAATDGAREPAVLTHTHTLIPLHSFIWDNGAREGVCLCVRLMISECAMDPRRGPSQSVKCFLCSLCVSATVGSTCVDDTPLGFIVHEVGEFRVTWGKHTDTHTEA